MDEEEDLPPSTEEAVDDADESEEDVGINMEELAKRFSSIKRQYNKSQKSIASSGREDDKAQKDLDKLGELLSFLSCHQKDSKLYLLQLGPWQKQLGTPIEKSMTFVNKIASFQEKTF